MVCTVIIVSSTWIFVKATVISFKGVETLVIFHCMETGSCQMLSSCMMNGKGGPGLGGREVHKNSGSSTYAVALDVTPGPYHTWSCLFPCGMARLSPSSWIYCLAIQEQTHFIGVTSFVSLWG